MPALLAAHLAFVALFLAKMDSTLFGLNHGIIDQTQYSHLVATVIGSAVIPTAIANAWFMPRRLFPPVERELRESASGEPVGDLDT